MAVGPIRTGVVENVNEAFFDAMLRHQIGLLRLSGGIRNKVHAILNATEQDIADKIRSRLANHRGFDTPASVARLETLLDTIRSTRLKSWQQVTDVWLAELREVAKAEPRFTDRALKTVMPVTLETVLPPTQLLSALVTTKPFEGKVLRSWAKDIARADIERIEGQIRIGMIQGEGSAAIARRVVGSARLRGRDGVTEITRRQAAAITRTAVNAFSNQARREYWTRNKKLIEKEIWVSTLDSRTTPICQSLDQEKFNVGEGPYPPIHMNCRSIRTGLVGPEAASERPANPSTERQLLQEFTKRNNLPTVTSRDRLPRGFKMEFDRFSRSRVRQMIGNVPSQLSYQEWLRGQSRQFQDEILGKTKAKLFREGGLTLNKFVNRAGDELTLAQLARFEARAFRAAGLDPGDFL